MSTHTHTDKHKFSIYNKTYHKTQINFIYHINPDIYANSNYYQAIPNPQLNLKLINTISLDCLPNIKNVGPWFSSCPTCLQRNIRI